MNKIVWFKNCFLFTLCIVKVENKYKGSISCLSDVLDETEFCDTEQETKQILIKEMAQIPKLIEKDLKEILEEANNG